ncbi:MAG: hypothetical protein K2F78_03415, partial [Muribaculaceae bacterium]|nr:hypothetical protein [Muribaculaceae bacterium]
MSSPHSILRYCIIALRSQRGRDTMMFLLFIVISCLLWAVMSLNDEKQYDRVSYTHHRAGETRESLVG